MKKYVFIVMPAQFNSTGGVEYDEVEHKKLNEAVEKIRILIMASDIKEGFEKAKQELGQIVSASFGDVKNIDNFSFRLRVIEVQNY